MNKEEIALKVSELPVFIKWAGGKRRLIPQIDPHLPSKVERYFEPFLGAGSMFFYIKQKFNPSFCMISDINEDLINVFKAVRDQPAELIKNLKSFQNMNNKTKYYLIRKRFNEGYFQGVKRCAAFVYLNKHCFNGLYRVNSKGEFNVPFGKFRNPELYQEDKIFFASKLLQGVHIVRQDYRNILKIARKSDFIYLDPCYDPLKKTSFAKYTPQRFTSEDNEELARFSHELRRRDAKVLLSNNVTDNVVRLYPDEHYQKVTVYCTRSINSLGGKRGAIAEYLIKNYA